MTLFTSRQGKAVIYTVTISVLESYHFVIHNIPSLIIACLDIKTKNVFLNYIVKFPHSLMHSGRLMSYLKQRLTVN